MARQLALYVHVPFCASRCGYCDFNTYTASELGDSVSRSSFHELLVTEVRQARAVLGDRPVETVFFGGGTPTLLGASALNAVLDSIRESFGLVDDAEVTTEANPDSVDESTLAQLRDGGFTRISFGMQSTAPHVLRVLDRTHTPDQAVRMAQAARRVGFEHTSIDLIYGTPGETDEDLSASIDATLQADVDHVSAYALIVEDATPLARRIRQGQIAAPDDDIAAQRYELVDDALTAAGLDWYEVSNWARPGGWCRHNLAYWHNAEWWGLGPGAHSHVDGVRWWNVKHPRTYAERIAAGASPLDGREVLTADERRTEAVMLAVRLREGLPLDRVPSIEALDDLVADNLIRITRERVVLTRTGRLLANRVITALLG